MRHANLPRAPVHSCGWALIIVGRSDGTVIFVSRLLRLSPNVPRVPTAMLGGITQESGLVVGTNNQIQTGCQNQLQEQKGLQLSVARGNGHERHDEAPARPFSRRKANLLGGRVIGVGSGSGGRPNELNRIQRSTASSYFKVRTCNLLLQHLSDPPSSTHLWIVVQPVCTFQSYNLYSPHMSPHSQHLYHLKLGRSAAAVEAYLRHCR